MTIPGFTSMLEDRTTYLLVATPLACTVLWLTARLFHTVVRVRRLPPGPKGFPFIGDVSHMADQDWLASPQRIDDYGDMMYVRALGTGVLIINSQRVAVDLLEKRSNIYSDRPHFISAGEFMTENSSLAFSIYGDRWRRFRRAAVEGFSKAAVPSFQPIQSREALILTLALMASPPDLEKHFRRHAASIMLSINYSLPPVDSEEDTVVVGITDHAKRLLIEAQPGKRLVEYFPWMKHIPSRFAKWKRDAQYWFIRDSLMFERLLGKVADDMRVGIDRPSFGAMVIKNQSRFHLSQRESAWVVGEIFAAGGETTSTTLEWWLLAMLVYPEVQARAHTELDEVVGRSRLPTFDDVPSLPYIRAMVNETLRWSPLTPLGIPHTSTTDDVYEGMFIPKGTICFQNMRVLNSRTEVFGSNAAEFDPSRYLDKEGRVKGQVGGKEEGHVSFGYGRRVCPGRFVAQRTLVIDIATLLWAMRLERPQGAQGELDTHTLVHSGITSHPLPFECKAVPRFREAEALLREALDMPVYG